jgi:predicted nucleic acid-binding protein
MPAETFLDTNVLVHLTGEDEKASTAEVLIESGAIISVQVLNELTSVWRRKYGYSWDRVRETLWSLRTLLEVVPLTLDTHDLGLSVAERYQLQLYDSLLLSSALLAGCKTFVSEDLHDGLVVERQLTIRNPFRLP